MSRSSSAATFKPLPTTGAWQLLHDQLIAELLDHALDLAIVYDLGLDAGTLHCHRLCEARPSSHAI